MKLLARLCLAVPLLVACKSSKMEAAAGEAEGATAAATATDQRPSDRPPPPRPEQEPLPSDPGEHGGEHAWSLRFGGADSATGRGLAAAPDGDLVATGYVKGTVRFAEGHEHTADGTDAYIARFGPDGALKWARAFGGPGEDIGEAVAVDSKGNALVVGSFGDVLSFGDAQIASEGADDAFVVKFAPDGRRLWAKRFGGIDVDAAHQVAVDADDNALVIGVFREQITFGKETFKSNGGDDIFLVKLSPEGDLVWARTWGESGKDWGRAVAVDGVGDILLLAEFTLGVDFGGGPLDNPGNRSLALVKLTPDGDHVWSRSHGNELDSLGIGIAVDPAGNVLVTGAFDETHSFGGEPHRARGRSDAFVARYGPDGSYLWSRAWGGEDEDVGHTVATDRFGNVYATGWFWKTADFGGGPVESAGYSDAFLVKLSPSGDYLWSKRFGGKQRDFGKGLVVTEDGGVALLGSFYFEVDLGGGALVAAGDHEAPLPKSDVFLARFSR
jgi:hypothetical protein